MVIFTLDKVTWSPLLDIQYGQYKNLGLLLTIYQDFFDIIMIFREYVFPNNSFESFI